MNFKRLIIAFAAVLFMISCQNKAEQTDTAAPPTISKSTQDKMDSVKLAQAWLVPAVEKFFNENHTEILEICTPQYEEYKMDAINVDYDGGMTVEQFQKKWAGKYNINLDQIGKSFLIGNQDNGKIKFQSCVPVNDTTMVFDCKIEDLDFKEIFYRKITISANSGRFQINDIEEIH
ncbi:MAG: hypothetical protein LCH67_09265 [Bacteroidetes bacterium]|nr:hypothetical protein [Bacteroidota bacterium]